MTPYPHTQNNYFEDKSSRPTGLWSSSSPLRSRSDFFGAVISGICAVHCTLTPFLFAARPLLETTGHAAAHGDYWWALLDYVFLFFSLLAVGYSVRRTDSPSIRIWLWVAWAVFALGLLLEPLELPFAKALMYVGSFTLIFAHLRNLRHCTVR